MSIVHIISKTDTLSRSMTMKTCLKYTLPSTYVPELKSNLCAVKLGYNGTGVPSCSQPLLDAYNVTTPTNGNLTYK